MVAIATGTRMKAILVDPTAKVAIDLDGSKAER